MKPLFLALLLIGCNAFDSQTKAERAALLAKADFLHGVITPRRFIKVIDSIGIAEDYPYSIYQIYHVPEVEEAIRLQREINAVTDNDFLDWLKLHVSYTGRQADRERAEYLKKRNK